MLIYFSKEAYLLSASLRRYVRTKTRIGVLPCLFSGVFLERWRQFLDLNLDNRSLFGALGEEYASQFLDGPDIISRVVNPIIPHSDGHRNPFESDFLVYTQGNLFCIEIKRYKGRITYAQQSRTSSLGERARNAHSQRIGQENVDGVDESMIVQEKTGNYGELRHLRCIPTL